MILDDALAQAKKAFGQITSQAGQAVTSATRDVGNFFQPQQLQSPIAHSQPQQIPSQFSQTLNQAVNTAGQAFRSIAPSLPFGIGGAYQGYQIGQNFANGNYDKQIVQGSQARGIDQYVPGGTQAGIDRVRQSLPQIGSNFNQTMQNNPVMNSLGPIGQVAGRTVGQAGQNIIDAGLSGFQKKSAFEHAGDVAGGVGAFVAPGSMIGGGALNVGFNAAQNVLGGKAPLQGAGQAYSQGIDFTNKLSALNPVVEKALSPILTRFAPEVKGGINTFLNAAFKATGEERNQLLRQAASYAASHIGAEGLKGFTSMGVLGATAPAQSLEDRFFNAFSQGLQGAAFSAGMGALGVGGEALGAGAKNQINESRLQMHNSFIDNAIEQQKKIESGQPRESNGKYGSMLDVPLLHVSLPGGQEFDIKPSQLEKNPEWRQSVVGPGVRNQPAQLLWQQAHSGGFIKPDEFLPKQNPEDFTKSLGESSGTQLPSLSQPLEQLPTQPIENKPLLQESGVNTQVQQPGETVPNSGGLPKEQVPTQPDIAPTSNISQDQSISQPSRQAEVDKLFNEAKIVKPNAAQGIVGAVRNLFDPVSGTINGADIKNAFREHRATFDRLATMAAKDSSDLTDQWSKVKTPDQLKFINGIETNQPIDAPGMKPGLAADYTKKFADDYKILQSIDPKSPFKEYYFTHNGLWADPKAASEFYNKWNEPQLQGPEGFNEKRSFPTIADGLQAGLKLKESNPETLYLNNHTNVLKSQFADNFTKEATSKGWDPQAVQAVVDRYMDPGIANNPIYKTARAANASLNAFQLGLSAFHFTTTTMNSIMSRASLGLEELSRGQVGEGATHILTSPAAPFFDYVRGNKVLSQAFDNNPQLSEDVQNVLKGGGKFKTDDVYKIGAWNTAIKDLKSNDPWAKVSGTAKLIPGLLEKASAPLMENYVPRLKLGAFADLAASKLQALGDSATPESQRAALSSAWDSVDNRFGQLVQDNLFWNKTLKDVGNAVTRSLGWNVGTVREIGGGVKDLLSAPKDIAQGKGISSRTAYAATLPIVTALTSALYMALHGVKPEGIKDYFYPRTGNMIPPKPGSPDQNSYPERVSMPGYGKDVVGFLHNPVQTIINKESPAIGVAGKAVELGATGGIKNYYGGYDVNPSSTGLQKAGEIGKTVASQFLPFSVTGANNRQELKTSNLPPSQGLLSGVKQQAQVALQHPEVATESFMGLNPAPGYITKGNNADLMNQSFNNKLSVAQTKKMFDMQKNGVDPQQYMKGVLNDRAANKTAKTNGTDPASIKDQAIRAYLQGDSTQAKSLGLTITGVKNYLTSKQLSAADALVSGDKQGSDTILNTYKTQIPPKVLMRASADRAMTLLQQANSFARTGDTKDRDIILSQFDELKQQYPFQFTQKDKLKLSQLMQ